jgi:hypothetical protein
MTFNNSEVEELLRNNAKGPSRAINAREVAALLESFGYSDRSVKEVGSPNIFSFAEDLFFRVQPEAKSEQKESEQKESEQKESEQKESEQKESEQKESDTPERFSLWGEISWGIRKFSFGLAYAVPWMALLALEYLRPNALDVPPELGGALSLALITSLITTGGFIQMISRSGSFYYALKEPVLARSTCMSLLNAGLTSSLLLGSLGMIIGAYFGLFAGHYLMLAAVNYVSLSLLWMFCSVLSVEGLGWCVPLVFLLSGFLCGLIKILAKTGNTILLTIWPVTAVLCALGCVLVGFHRAEKNFSGSRKGARPRFGVLAISLAPFYLYGTLYFSFLFADRLAAGSAVPWTSGLSFGIDPAYKSGMDLVLLAFLITAAVVEYLSDSFLRFWRRLAAELPQAKGEELIVSLRRRHWKTILVIFTMFIVFSLGAWLAFSHVSGATHSPRLLQTAALGGLGYLMLSMALLEIVILASINATSLALTAIAFGLGVNMIAGYGLSHYWGVQYAAAGLLAGSTVVLWKCNAAVREVLRRPDYHYSIS